MQRYVQRAAVLAAMLWGPAAARAQAVSDDFNDGNDAGWTRYSPLAPAAAGRFTFPSGGYRVEAPASPAPEVVGPARAGSFRRDESYSQFVVSVDLVDWDNTLDQAFGLLARARTPGLGTTDGYAFTYTTSLQTIDISAIDGELAETVASADVRLDPARDYRLVFRGTGTALSGSVYELADPSTPLATASVTDATYASGFNGLFVFDTSNTGDRTADATFDNYSAAVPEPAGATLVLLAGAVPALGRRRRP